MFHFRLPRLNFGWGSGSGGINIPSVKIHDVETAADKRSRTLKHLLKANHVNHSIIYHNLTFHNHCPHILGSAYILGATSEQLNIIYDSEAKQLEPWHDAPGEISEEDWHEYLGKREYQRAFVDFFEDQLVTRGYDWKELLEVYLFEGQRPLINSLISGLAHPLIHVGYGYELGSRTVAIEGLAMASCFYSDLHKYIDDPNYTKPATYTAKTPLNVLHMIALDTRLDGFVEEMGNEDASPLMLKHEAIVLDHWNAWKVTDPKKQFEESQKAAVALLVATHRHGKGKYDFFLCHMLTSSHAVRILLPLIPAKFHIPLVRQWFLFVVIFYISQNRPPIKEKVIEEYDIGDRSWKHVVDKAVNSQWATDAHFVKACRAMKEAAQTWGDDKMYYLKAALKFTDEYDDWGGFGNMSKEDAEAVAQFRKESKEGEGGE